MCLLFPSRRPVLIDWPFFHSNNSRTTDLILECGVVVLTQKSKLFKLDMFTPSSIASRLTFFNNITL